MAQPPQTIYDRIIQAIHSRGRTESERAFCTKIGLSPTYLSSLRDNCQKDPERSIDVATASKFARELGIDIETLTGIDPLPVDDPYPSRLDAVLAARAMKFSQHAIDSAYREDPGSDPGRLWWFHRIEAEESRLQFPSAPSPFSLETQRSRSVNGRRKR